MNEDQYEDAYNNAAEDYYAAEDQKSRLEALENLVRLADSAGDIHGAYNARMEMVQCANFAGQNDKALVAFTWCLSQSDKFPDQFDMHSLLWKFKWILENAPTFSQISKEKIYELQDDLQKRLQESGYNLRPILFLRWVNAMRMGEFERAGQHMEKWRETTRDNMADCKACEENKLSEYFGRVGQLDRSVEVAEKLLDGRMTCAEVPHLTFGHLVPTYLKLGRVDELKKNHSAWYNLIKDNEDLLTPIARQFLLLGGTLQFPQAVAIFERHSSWAVRTVSDEDRFNFYDAAGLVFEKMSQSESTIRLHVPDGFEFKRDDQTYQCEELAQWFQREATSLATRFDQRNGNPYFSEQMIESKKLLSSI